MMNAANTGDLLTINLSWYEGEIDAVSCTIPGGFAQFMDQPLSWWDEIADLVSRTIRERTGRTVHFKTPIPRFDVLPNGALVLMD